MGGNGLSKKQLLLFIGSIVMLIGVFIFFSLKSRKQNTAETTTPVGSTTSKTAIPKDIYQVRQTDTTAVTDLVTYTAQNFSVTYPAPWHIYLSTLKNGEKAYLIKNGILGNKDAYPSLQISEKKADETTDSEYAFLQSVFVDHYHFIENVLPVNGQVVNELLGVQPADTQHTLPRYTHVLFFTRNTFRYHIEYIYVGSAPQKDDEAIFNGIIDSFSFTQPQ